jgi:hypothetical protein
LELWLGPHPDRGSIFNSREELQEAWEKHRDEVMARWGSHCRRPQGWWEFSAPDGLERPDNYDDEPRFLFEHGLLTEAERAQFEKKSPRPQRPSRALISLQTRRTLKS